MKYHSRLISLAAGTAVFLVLQVNPAAPQALGDLSEFMEGTPPAFSTPAMALDHLKRALTRESVDDLAVLLGLSSAKLAASQDAMTSYVLIRGGADRRIQLQDLGERKIVLIGNQLWPFPFPLSQDAEGKWAFDTDVGLQEIVNRRVGANELATIQTMQEYVLAQYEYAREDKDEDGIFEFAQKLISSPGKQNGLYWPSGEFDSESPASSLVETAAFDKAKEGEGYYGYRYRILTGQGANVVGDKQSYIVNGNMTGGFALIAWPVKYRVTGVKTFVVNGAGIIYEVDLGERTPELASAIREFDPDGKWDIVSD